MPCQNYNEYSNSETLEEYGPFELLQAQQLIESHIASFATAIQIVKADIIKLHAILEQKKQAIQKNI